MELQGRTALVTGGARRVGREIARTLAREGCDLILHFRASRGEAEDAAREIRSLGRRCELVQADLADAGSVEAMLREIERCCPPVDVLVNSASVFYRAPLDEVTVDQWDDNLNVNLRAPFLLARSLGLAMKSRGAGKIINIADTAVRRPYKGYVPYLVSKAGLVALTEALALELAPEVQVNAVSPGTVLLPENAPAALEAGIVRRTPLGRIGTPQDVAWMVLHLVKHGDFMTGGNYLVDGGSALGR